MEAKDLMIGDLVQGFVPDSYSTIYGIFNEQRIAIIAEPSKAYIELFVDDIQPIPLTPEILEKNGFENDFYEDESVADYIKVRNEGYSLHSAAHEWDGALITWCNGHVNVVTDFSGEYRGEIEYVHELQHALRLCGIDKEIVVC